MPQCFHSTVKELQIRAKSRNQRVIRLGTAGECKVHRQMMSSSFIRYFVIVQLCSSSKTLINEILVIQKILHFILQRSSAFDGFYANE